MMPGVTSDGSEPPLRVLLLEDSAADAELITHELERAGIGCVTQRVDTEAAFVHALRSFEPDIVLFDHGVARFDAVATLRVARSERPATPIIVVTSKLDEQAAVDTLKAGVDDYLLKEHLTRLGPAIAAAQSVRGPLRRLTPRQIDVLRLMAEGLTTRDIARRLTLSVKTVETHRAAVMSRLAIHDLAGLVRYALKVGLISQGF
jgi:DNA-binding NarL/FixJ family response regulator